MSPLRLSRYFLIVISLMLTDKSFSDEVRVPGHSPLIIGQGFHSHKETGTSHCLQATNQRSGQRITSLNIHQPLTDEQLQSLLLPAGLSFQSSAGGSLNSWLINHESSPNKISLRYLIRIGGVEDSISQAELTESARALYLSDLQRFLASCGDQFIHRIEYGGYLIIAVSFQFRSAHLATRFNREANLDFTGIEDFPAKIAYALGEFNDRVSISVSARQIGGDASNLNRILSGGSIFCSSENLAACSKLGENLISYLTIPGGFYDQINNEMNQGHPSPITYYGRPYSDLPDSSIISPQIPISATNAKQSILNQLNATFRDQKALYRININQESESLRLVLAMIREKIEFNLNVIQSSVSRCRASFSDCVLQAQSLEAKLKSYDRNLLKPALTFIDYCLEAKTEEDEAFNTIQALRKLPGLGRTNCFDDHQQLNTFSTMNLSGQNITDTGPLHGFKQLISLDLSHNQLKSIDTLQTLTNLKDLDLSYALESPEVKLSLLPNQLKRLGLWGNHLIEEEVMRAFPNVDELWVTHESVCTRELKWMLDQSMLDRVDFNFWSSQGFGPGWIKYRRQADGFFRCAMVSSQYRLLTPDLF